MISIPQVERPFLKRNDEDHPAQSDPNIHDNFKSILYMGTISTSSSLGFRTIMIAMSK